MSKDADQKLIDMGVLCQEQQAAIRSLTAQLAEARVLLERAAETLAGDAHEKTRRGVCEGCAVLADISAFLSSPAPAPPDPRDNQIRLLKAALRLTALRWVPGITHEQIDAHIEAILRGETVPMGELARFATKPGDAP